VLRPRVGAHTTAAMPWQTAPGLVIITVAFAAGGYLIGGTNYLFTGRFRRQLNMDSWDWELVHRDNRIKQMLKEKGK